MAYFNEYDTRRLGSSFLLTIIFWTVIVLILAFIPVRMQKVQSLQYKDIKIILHPENSLVIPIIEEPLPKKVFEPSQEQVQASPSPQVEKSLDYVQSPPQTSPVQTDTVRTSIAGTEQKSAGLGIPNFARPIQSSSDADGEAEYLDFSSMQEHSHQEIAQSQTSGNPMAEFEGSAGVIKKEESKGAFLNITDNQIEKTSGDTKKALEKITSAQEYGPIYENAYGTETSTATTNIGQNVNDTEELIHSGSVLTFEGKTRKLLYPEKPIVVLPEHLVYLIDSDKQVHIQFTVLAEGTVPIGHIKFLPEAILPAEIRDFLRREFSRWRFEKYIEDGQARFEYSIKTK